MKRLQHWSLLALFALVTGCSQIDEHEPSTGSSQELLANGAEIIMSASSDWGSGYCSQVAIKNTGSTAITSWTVVVSLGGSTLGNAWSATTQVNNGRLTATPASYNASIAPGQSVSFGFCGNSVNSTQRPTLVSATMQGGSGGVGGSSGVGGAATGGSIATGGAKATGGASATGGTATGGTKATGGTSTTGGSKATGGWTSTGGTKATGGTSTGGANTGGSGGTCTPTWGTPPSNVSAWIDESWNAQLGSNIRSRSAWLLDSVMKGKGQINLCVRWGASSAPSAAVKAGLAGAVQKWFNDWFAQLSGYGCFPYTSIATKVTGWAVKPGNTGWVSDLGSDVRIYTEVDGAGEPKCSDACSFFSNWSHNFPNCPGGEAFHHDYWLWLNDSISGGAAAVGGDWGLRMPVANFIAAMNKSNLVIEHEMGHGFGFQDYYDWTGSRPVGGSLMIVGSTSSQSPTTADTWLLRRTWKEMKALRGW